MNNLTSFLAAVYEELCVLLFIDRLIGKKLHQYGRSTRHSKNPNPIQRLIYFLGFSEGKVEQPKSGNEKDYSTEQRRFALELAAFRLARLGAVVAIVGGCAIIRQMKANLRQADAAQQQLTETHIQNRIQFLAMQEQIEQAKRQADAAQKQLAEMQAATQLDERARVSIYNTDESFTLFLSGGYQVGYTNTGKTPALNVRPLISVADYLPTALQTQINWKTPGNGGCVMPPNSGRVLGVSFSESPMKSQHVYFFGKIWYDDIFGGQHWTTFCTEFLQEHNGWHIDATGRGNSCEENKTGDTSLEP